MKTFTIDQLRADVVSNFADQIDSKTSLKLQTTRHGSGKTHGISYYSIFSQYDALINFQIAALIGQHPSIYCKVSARNTYGQISL